MLSIMDGAFGARTGIINKDVELWVRALDVFSQPPHLGQAGQVARHWLYGAAALRRAAHALRRSLGLGPCPWRHKGR